MSERRSFLSFFVHLEENAEGVCSVLQTEQVHQTAKNDEDTECPDIHTNALAHLISQSRDRYSKRDRRERKNAIYQNTISIRMRPAMLPQQLTDSGHDLRLHTELLLESMSRSHVNKAWCSIA